MNRFRTTEEPGVWRLMHETEPRRKITLEIFEGPGVRRRTIEIVADGGICIDGNVIMASASPPLRKAYTAKAPDMFTEDIRSVAQEVSDISGVTVDEMQGKSTHYRISQARKVAIYLIVRRLGITYKDTAVFFGRSWEVIRNHVEDVASQCRAANPDPHGIVETSEAF